MGVFWSSTFCIFITCSVHLVHHSYKLRCLHSNLLRYMHNQICLMLWYPNNPSRYHHVTTRNHDDLEISKRRNLNSLPLQLALHYVWFTTFCTIISTADVAKTKFQISFAPFLACVLAVLLLVLPSLVCYFNEKPGCKRKFTYSSSQVVLY